MSKVRELLKKILATRWLDHALSCEVEKLLAQPEQEPVVWIDPENYKQAIAKPDGALRYITRTPNDGDIPLYASPPKHEPLSDEHWSKK